MFKFMKLPKVGLWKRAPLYSFVLNLLYEKVGFSNGCWQRFLDLFFMLVRQQDYDQMHFRLLAYKTLQDLNISRNRKKLTFFPSCQKYSILHVLLHHHRRKTCAMMHFHLTNCAKQQILILHDCICTWIAQTHYLFES